jgi:putative aldouronate transport system permease protein
MFGILTAFKDYSLAKGVIGSPWAGLKYFQQFVTSIFFPTVVKNTVCIGLLKVLFAFPAPIVLALLLNELRSNKLKHVIQTASYLPYFVSWAIVLGIWFRLLSVDGGLVNNLLVGLKLTDKPINFTQTPQYMWPFAVFTEVWKNIGFNSIIYVAALSTINPELYEAARIDGAGRFRQLLHITLPEIRPTIAILFIFTMGTIFGGTGGMQNSNFEQMLILGSTPVRNVTEIIDTYIYRIGLQNLQYSVATAAGLLRSVLSLLVLIVTNKVIVLLGESGIW